MKFTCYECQKERPVKHRVFEHVDWCRTCVKRHASDEI